MDWELLSDQPLWEKLIKKGFWLYFFAYLIAPAGYIVKVLVSNSLSVEDVGILYTIVSLLWLLNVYNDLGLTESLQYFLPRYRIKKQYNYIKTSIYISLSMQMLTAGVIATFLRLGAPWLAENYFHSESSIVILRYFCFFFLGINLFQTMQSIFVAFQNTFDYQFIDFIRMRSIVGFTIFFFFTWRQSIEWYSLNRILWLAVGIVFSYIIFHKKYKKRLLQGDFVRERPMLREYMKYALRCFLWSNISSLFGQIIQQLVIIIIWPESAWYYTNFLSLFSMWFFIIWPILWLIFPIVSELINKKDTIKLSWLFNFFYTYFSVFSFTLAIILLFLWKEIALIVFWTKFLFSGALISIAAIFIVFNILQGFNFSVLAGMGKIKERVKIMAISTLFVIVTALLFIHMFWIYWAIIGFCLGQLLLFILSYIILDKQIKITIDWYFVIKNIVFASLLGILIWYFKSTIFIFDDLLRYNNLWKLMFILIGFYILIGIFNWEKIITLKGEVMKLRK